MLALGKHLSGHEDRLDLIFVHPPQIQLGTLQRVFIAVTGPRIEPS